jgi:hypothetical protein
VDNAVVDGTRTVAMPASASIVCVTVQDDDTEPLAEDHMIYLPLVQ